MRRALGAILLAPLVGAALLLGAVNLGTDVVTLTTIDTEGNRYETPVWILDDEGELWIRAERPTSDWLERLRRNPQIEIERGGARTEYRATPSPESRADVNRRMGERYGWAEWMIGAIQDRSAAVPIRLVPLAAVASGSLAASSATSPPPPNILWLAADDLDYGSLGFTGSAVPLVSPNLDRLASEGIVFTQAYVNVAVCIPSRAVWMTGRYPLRSGATGFSSIRPDVPTLPRVLAGAGYLTGVIGKARHYRKRASYAWDVRVESAELEEGRSPSAYHEQTRLFLERARAEARPFFLHVNTNDPHRPFAGSRQEKPTAAWIRERNDSEFVYPAVTDPVSPADAVIPPFLPDLPEVREEVAQYFGSVRRMDRSLGEVLRALAESGAAGDTIVVFTADHGMSFPFGKSNCYRQSLHVPLVIRWPGQVAPGSRDGDHLVAGIDLLPTLLELAGQAPLEAIDGRSFAAVVRGGRLPGFERVFGSFHATVNEEDYPMRGVQEARWGYVYNPWSDGEKIFVNESQMGLSFEAMQKAAPSDAELAARVSHFLRRTREELYDYESDPGARVNRIDDPDQRERVSRMRQALLEQMVAIDDPLAAQFAREIGSPLAATSSR